jgi:tetratricopeptide (TPR) repeat protein
MDSLLLKTEEMNSSYVSMDTITYMPEVLNHYKFHGTYNERMRAYYMMGCVYRDRGNSPQALVYFNEAVRQIDSLHTNHYLLSRIYAQIANLFHYQRFPQKEFAIWNQCRDHAFLAHDSLMAAIALDRLSTAYYDLGIRDTSFMLTHQAYEEYIHLGRWDYAASTLITMIDYDLMHHNLPDAKDYLDEYLSNSGVFVNGIAQEGYELIYFYIGKYKEENLELDSALYYYKKLISNTDNISSLESGYRGLMSAYTKLGSADSALKYIELFANANDSANFLHSADEISRAEMLYNFTENQQLALKKSQEVIRLWHVFYLTLFIIAVCLILLVWYLKRQRRVHELHLSSINIKYNEVLNQYAKTTQELELLKLDSSVSVQKKEAELNELRHILLTYQDNDNPELWDIEQSLFNHGIVQRLHKYATRIVVPTESEWSDLMGVVNKLLPDFSLHLQSYKEDLTEKEYKVCVLLRLNFIPSELAVLLSLTKQRITNIRCSINKKLFNQEGARTVDANLRQL